LRLPFDTNIVLDLLLDREPFSTRVALLFSEVEKGELSGYLCAATMTTVHFLARKAIGAKKAAREVGKLLSLFEIAPVNRPVLEAALRSKFPDFEDAVAHEAALHVGVDGIVTRDIRGFKRATLPVYSPEELIQILRVRDEATE
jgi:predicted nucleic acid-binding protein